MIIYDSHKDAYIVRHAVGPVNHISNHIVVVVAGGSVGTFNFNNTIDRDNLESIPYDNI